MLNEVDIVEKDELRGWVLSTAKNTTLVVPDSLSEPLIGPELVERIRAKWNIAELLWGRALLETVMDELLDEGGLADAATADDAEQSLVLKLAIGLFRAG
jgi:hypothetical protein